MSGRADGGASGGGGVGTFPPVDEIKVSDRQISSPYTREENPVNSGGDLWIRDWKLSVGDQQTASNDGAGFNARDLSQLDFTFRVESAAYQTPTHAVIKIFNVNRDIVSQLSQQLKFVWLEAGYAKPSSQYGKIFGGEIVYFKHGREGGTDTYVEIHAFQSDQPLTAAIINTTLPAGHTKHDVLKAVADAMGVQLGQVMDLGSEKMTRSRALYGMAESVLRDITDTANAQSFISKDGKLNVLAKGTALTMNNVSVPVLNSKTGLIDMPILTLGRGVDIRCLLNPNIYPGGQVHINQQDVSKIEKVNAALFADLGLKLETHELTFQVDGYYRINSVRHHGESRGNAWYTEMVTESYNPTENPIGPVTSI